MKAPIPLLALVLLTTTTLHGLFSADWPPAPDEKNTVTQSIDGRTIERYTHGPRESWGYPTDNPDIWKYAEPKEAGPSQQNHSSFYIISPKVPRENAPLCVVLHSANRTAYDYLGFASLNRKIDGNDDPSKVMTNSPDDFYALYLNSTNAEWWGYSQARQNLSKKIYTAPPAELRVLDTIEWVVNKYKIDRNRIYLCGVSMGGCGTLGIGMPNGNVFAAILADVPAGTNYANYRMGGFAPSPSLDATQKEIDEWKKRASAVGLPDPPVIVDFSSQTDNWSVTQPALLQAAQIGKLPLVLSWGPFGHTTFSSSIEKFPYCEVALAFPWFEIRKNEAYPVFTRASCDQRSPWMFTPVEFDANGQINALFRWKSQKDTSSDFSIQLWIDHPQTVKNPQPSLPKEATADVTLRRLQQFKIQQGKTYSWQLSQNGKEIASGKATPDAYNLLTLPQLKLATIPSELTLKAD